MGEHLQEKMIEKIERKVDNLTKINNCKMKNTKYFRYYRA